MLKLTSTILATFTLDFSFTSRYFLTATSCADFAFSYFFSASYKILSERDFGVGTYKCVFDFSFDRVSEWFD